MLSSEDTENVPVNPYLGTFGLISILLFEGPCLSCIGGDGENERMNQPQFGVHRDSSVSPDSAQFSGRCPDMAVLLLICLSIFLRCISRSLIRRTSQLLRT